MKILRPILAGVAVLAALLVVVLVLAFTPSVQTWAARKAIFGLKDIKADVGRVSAGLKVIELTNIKIEKPGFVLTLPSLTIEMPLVSVAGKKIVVHRLLAKGWKVDLSVPTTEQLAAAHASANATPEKTIAQAQPTATEPFAFDGLFKLLRLPVDFSLDEIDVEGEVVLHAVTGLPPAHASVHLTGGKLKAGGEGRFHSATKIVIDDASAPVSQVAIDSVIVAQMDTPRTFQKISVVTEVKAAGTQFPQGANLHSECELNGVAGGETYAVSLQIPSAGVA